MAPTRHSELIPPATAARGWYVRAFAVHEIEGSAPLQWLSVALLVAFLLTFHDWARAVEITRETAQAGEQLCWPVFQDCGRYYFLRALPRSYSQTTAYTGLFAIIVASAYFMWGRRWVAVHGTILTLFIAKMAVFALSMGFAANFHYFHLVFTFLWLFARHKLFFLRRTMVLLYLLAGLIKLNDGWIVGTYFSSLHAGLPLVPDVLVPVATNGVIVIELCLAPLLLSERRWQRAVLAVFVAFHVYSTILVMYRYPTMVMGPLLCLFAPRVQNMAAPVEPRAIVGWWVVVAWVCLQAIALVIPGDSRVTLEGNHYGVFMFEANHQCRSSTRVIRGDGTREAWQYTDRTHAHHRCDPYAKWFGLQQRCKEPGIAAIEWTFDHSINGGPLRRIVEERDACALEYRPFAHNPWIALGDEARVVAQPVKNIY